MFTNWHSEMVDCPDRMNQRSVTRCKLSTIGFARLNLLPTPSPSSLFGRAHDIDAVGALLRRDDVPLITLSGPGGVGKTRLALQVADDYGHDFSDGVCIVELSALRDSSLVMPTIASALNLRDEGVRSTASKLADYLGRRQSLLVLDNLEHVVQSGREVADLLAACPNLKILTTSRELLRVRAEHNVPVHPLRMPAAVQLFVERAKSVNTTFKLTPENQTIVAAICTRLDGLPLAIELAAARVRELPVLTLLDRLDRALPILTGGDDRQPSRLRTMRDAIAWSHELLNTDEQAIFRRISVFAGGIDLDRVEPVVASDLADVEVLDGVASLVEKNLLQVTDLPGKRAVRYRMLETVREFGLEQLELHGELVETQRAYAEHFAQLADGTNLGQYSTSFPQTLNALDVEHANALTVLEWSLATGELELGLEMVASMGPYWIFRGHYRDGRDWIKRFLDRVSTEPTQGRARALVRAGWLANLQGDAAGADELLVDGIDVAMISGEDNMQAQGRIAMSLVKLQQGDYAGASFNAGESFRLYLALDPGNPNFEYWASMSLIIQGQSAALSGDSELAAMYSSQAVERMGRLPAAWALGASLRVLGDLAHDAGDATWALAYYRESVQLAEERSDARLLAESISGMASLTFKAGNAIQAARLYGAVASLREREGITEGWDRREHSRREALVKASLSTESYEWEWAKGAETPLAKLLRDPSEDEAPDASPIEADRKLTARELQVLRLVAQGYSNHQIGESLGISHRTAGVHVGNLLAKIGVETRTAAASFAIREGLT
ncbi:LuxR family transcriptional regulator [soil metagenome]